MCGNISSLKGATRLGSMTLSPTIMLLPFQKRRSGLHSARALVFDEKLERSEHDCSISKRLHGSWCIRL